MALVNGNDYDHIDLQAAAGGDVTRHMLKDAKAREDVSALKSNLDQFGIVKTSQVGTDSIDETETEDTNVYVKITGTYKKKHIYRITVYFREVHWKSNGAQFLQIKSYNYNSISSTYLVDSIQEATVSVTGNVSIDYQTTTDTVEMIGFVFFLGSGTQDIDVRVDEVYSEASDKIQELEQLTDPYCDEKDYPFSGSVSNTTTAFHLRYNIFKGEKYRLTMKCITGTSIEGNCLRAATGDVANFGTSYNKDILNGATSLNPLCGKIDSFSAGEIISEDFTASENALYINLMYYGVNPSNYDMDFKVSRITTVKDLDKAVFGRGVVELNKDVEPFMLQFGREISSQTSEHSYKRLNFLFFSDIHANMELWNRICDYMDYYDDIIPFAVHAGDYVSNNLGSVVDLYGERKPKNGAILNTVGNHDCYPSGSSTPNAPIADVYNALYESVDPVTDGWNCTFNTTQYCMYWYKDIADTGVRLICIDQYHWDAAQSTFISNALDDAVTNGYAVITITHTPITTSVDDIKSGFWTLDNWVVNDTYRDDMITIRALINAFISGGGVHIVNLCGHIHSDQIGLLHDDDIFQIRTQMAGNNELWTDTHRVVGTKTWDCFNVIQIDMNLTMLKLVRIGCNSSDCLQPRTTLCWDYANKKLISNT